MLGNANGDSEGCVNDIDKNENSEESSGEDEDDEEMYVVRSTQNNHLCTGNVTVKKENGNRSDQINAGEKDSLRINQAGLSVVSQTQSEGVIANHETAVHTTRSNTK